jgi:hypothetical protein
MSSGLFLLTILATLFLILATFANGQSCAVKARVMECKLAKNGVPCDQRPPSTPGAPCVELSNLKYSFQNTGSLALRITTATRTINNGPAVQLVQKLSPNPIPVGRTGTIQEQIYINYCNAPAVQGIKIRAGGSCT